jgi:hypothetical protein
MPEHEVKSRHGDYRGLAYILLGVVLAALLVFVGVPVLLWYLGVLTGLQSLLAAVLVPVALVVGCKVWGKLR